MRLPPPLAGEGWGGGCGRSTIAAQPSAFCRRLAPTELEQIGPLYANLMEEIKRRVDVIRRVLDGTYPMPQMAAFEFCYLQLRKICEVFALACLAAHGDIPAVRTKLLQKTYHADRIIKQLAALHHQFYPVPSEQRLDPVTQKPVEVVPITTGFLTKDELLSLYGECGNYLHRGTIRQLLTRWEPTINFNRIVAWIDKIVRLLNHHQIKTSQPETQLWVLMHDKEFGKVHWFIMKEIPNPSLAV
jgi:hypothetical protein